MDENGTCWWSQRSTDLHEWCTYGRDEFDPHQLREAFLEIESSCGPPKSIRWGARHLDLDILLFDEQQICSDALSIPHPRMCVRRFVLQPAAEIAADWLHPSCGWTIKELHENLDTKKRVWLTSPAPELAFDYFELEDRSAVGQHYVGHWCPQWFLLGESDLLKWNVAKKLVGVREPIVDPKLLVVLDASPDWFAENDSSRLHATEWCQRRRRFWRAIKKNELCTSSRFRSAGTRMVQNPIGCRHRGNDAMSYGLGN